MHKLLLLFFILQSCSFRNIRTGGHKSYSYISDHDYTFNELKDMSQDHISTLQRDPHEAPLSKLFTPGLLPIRKIGIIVFETEIQPTRGGLSGKNHIYLSNAGKQIMTENFLKIWEESFSTFSSDIKFVPTSQIKLIKPFHLYGTLEEDFIQSERTVLAPDDIFYLDSGKNVSTTSLMNPRGMRDISLILIPASELLGGPKWSEHGKHFINDVTKELNLDAVLNIVSYVSWTAAHTDKHSGQLIPEEINLELKASVLIPLSEYHRRLNQLNLREEPGVTVCYRKYESEIKIPINISSQNNVKNFDTISKELLSPLMKTYKDFSQMTMMRIKEDLNKTW
jgi:hypothetical protein